MSVRAVPLNSSKIWPLLACGLVIEAGLLWLLWLGNLTQQAGAYVVLFSVLTGIFGLACWLVWHRNAAAANQTWQRPTLLVILAFAVIFRLTTLLAAPTLSTDQFRYIWEGRLITLGLSPYRYAPNDPALQSYHDFIWPLVQQKETASDYPPLAQLVGVVEYELFSESLLGPKIMAVLFDLLCCAVLLWLLGLYGLDKRRVILYAWCPLPIIEFGQSGHNDGPMLLFMLLAIGLVVKDKPKLSAVALGLACLAKFTPLFVLPLFMVAWQKPSGSSWRLLLRPRTWLYPLITLGVIVVGYLPFLLIGQGAIGSILEYTGSWHDNQALVFGVLAALVGESVAKLFSIAALGVTVLLLAFVAPFNTNLSLPRRITVVFGVTLLVASTVHPWYVTWILVLFPLVYATKPWGFLAWDTGWLGFSVLVQLVYLSYAGDGSAYIWATPLEYWPLYLIGGGSLFRWWWRQRAAITHSKFQKIENM